MRSQHPGILVKLLPSIDRSKSVAEAEENISIVLDLLPQHKDIITGVDLSGDPVKGDFKDFLIILEKARKSHLKLALHCGEVRNDDEILEMLEFGMDRLGHGTFVNGMEHNREHEDDVNEYFHQTHFLKVGPFWIENGFPSSAV
jgi:adenosine deaminase